MIRYRVSRNADGEWEVAYRYNPTSQWFRITAYLLWVDAIAHAFTAVEYRTLKLAINSAYGK